MRRDVTTGGSAAGRYQGTGATCSARFRLTRRGRRARRFLGWFGATAVVAAVITAVVLGLTAAFAPGARAGDGAPGAGARVTVTVDPGESLWSLAVQHQPGRDPRQVVADIEQINDLPNGSLLQVGTQLMVPTD